MKTPWLSLLCLAALSLQAASSFRPVQLRCEYLDHPLGIDAARPRLSWILEPRNPQARGARQTAYEVIVASTAARLAANQGDLWASGEVTSDQSIQVHYEGARLASGQDCFWKVRAWDEAGVASEWSRPAHWSVGLLEPADWHGVWIGKDEQEQASFLSDASWIWFPEGDPASAAPVGVRYFRRRFEIPEKAKVSAARLLVAGDNEFTVFVNGHQVGIGSNFKAASEFDVASLLAAGENVVAVSVNNVGDSPNPAGLLARLEVTLNPGGHFFIATDQDWKASRIAVEGWTGRDFNHGGWSDAKVLGPAGMAPWGQVAGPEERRLAARQLRKEFAVEKKVRRAMVYFSGLGLSELYLNGKKVGDEVLSPGLTEYPKRVFYVTHDVTKLLKRGANCVGAWLGNGRYYAPRSTVPTGTRTYGYPKLQLELRIEYTDGSTAAVVSDGTWKLTTEGPIRANNEYDGEEYDARKEMPGWAEAGFKNEGWEPAQTVAAPGGKLVAQMIRPIRVVQTIKPVSFKELSHGVWIYDLGQNMVGWCRLKVRGKAGTVVTLRHAELLKPDGSLYLDNIRSAKVTDLYTLRGKGTELYEPSFTYHGFRFVELRGFPGKPDLETLEGRVVHDDLESAGEWSCSNPLLNQLYRNIWWGVSGNYRSISTDCPQRDERQGWLGDRSEESKGETFLFDTAALYAKWVQDMADAQKDNGSVPDVCPSYWPIYSDNVTWPSSTVIIPGHLYTQFADADLIASHYPSMKLWVDHMATFIKDDLMPRDTYGDWCVPPEDPKLIHSKDPMRKTNPTILGTTYFYHCLELMGNYAERLGKADDARRYRELAARLKTAFNAKFYDPQKGYYDNGSQTSCVLPLALGLVPADQNQRVFDHLIDKITHETKDHVGTGLVGGQWLMRTLNDHGRSDLGYILASNRTYPSWGYMIEKGATTIWELWNGDTADPAMNSGNHVMLVGDLVIWFYEDLAGIKSDPRHPGFKRILMEPHPVGDLTHLKATHRSPYGLIASEWRREAGKFSWQITVPANTTATLYVPAATADAVTESGKPAAQAVGLKYVGLESGRAVFEVAPGRYSFTSR